MLFLPFDFHPCCFYGQIYSQNNQNFLKSSFLQNFSPQFNHREVFNSFEKSIDLTNQKNYVFSNEINKIFEKTIQINGMLTSLQKNIFRMQQELDCINFSLESNQKEQSAQTRPVQTQSSQKIQISALGSNRTHPKIKLMEKIFGKKQYSYKLAFNGKFPKYLYKQRNISLKILLKNKQGQPIINGNQLSLNLKVYQNNGEQIFLDKENTDFMNGICQSSMQKGVGNFSKIHPKQVSRNFSGKGVCIIIYATSQLNHASDKGLIIQASEIQPIIFYNIKVVVKQQKMLKKNALEKSSEQDY